MLLGSGCIGEQPSDEQVLALGTIEQAATVPSGFVDELVVSGLSAPTAFAFAPDGRLFITQQNGRVRVVDNGVLIGDFVSVTTSSTGERGALGIAFDPNFSSNGYVYVYYTALTPAVHNRISRFRASGNVAAAGSETVILDLDNLSSATNHNGGALHFGADGKLYVAVGDNALGSNAQTLNNLHGKMLRINADGTIPSDNPYYATATGKNRAIWARGLRNPYTFSFAPSSGRMFINDVGQETWEEINEGGAGLNYGWPTYEGPSTQAGFQAPLYAYRQGSSGQEGTGCAITGGTFYSPSASQYPGTYVGKYFFADYCGNFVRVLDPTTRTTSSFVSGARAPIDLTVGPDALLYRLERGDSTSAGAVYRVRYSASGQAPVITTQPTSVTAALGQVASFTVVASGSTPLSYQWQRNGVNIAGATAPSYSFTVGAGDAGAQFRAVVTNPLGSVTSAAASLTIPANRPPSVTITSPVSTSYIGGISIPYAATASDPEDGELPASAFTWLVEIHHDQHTHPFLGPVSGQREGSFVVPTEGHNQLTAFFRIQVSVRDSGGLVTTAFRDVFPTSSAIGLETVPSGLQIVFEGAPVTAPTSVPAVMFMKYTLSVVTPQILEGRAYEFVGWFGENPATTLDYIVPANSALVVAVFRELEVADVNLALQGRPIARVTAPVGGGSRNLEVIRDGVKPAVGSRESSAQYDTFTGRASAQDWIGYEFDRTYTFSRVVFQEGRNYWYGGWFSNLRAQVRQGSSWVDVSGLSISPAYPRNNGVSFETYTLTFAPVQGTGIRLYGRPGGLLDFISVGELEVYAAP